MRYDAAGGMLGLLAISAVMFLGFSVGDAHAQTTVQIGALLTDAQSNADRFEAMSLAADDFNSANPDYRLMIAPYNLGDDPLAALQAAYDNGNGPKYYVGPTSSGNVDIVREFADANNIIIVSPSSTAARLAIEGDTTFRLAPSDAKQAPFIAELLEGDDKTHIVIPYRDDAWGQGLATNIPANYEDATFIPIPFDVDATDHTSLVVEIKDALDALGAPSPLNAAVLYLGFENNAITTFEAIHANPDVSSVLDVRWYGADGIANKPSIASHPIAGPLANQVDLTGTIFFISESDFTLSVKDRLSSKVVGELNQYIYTSYDAVSIIGESVKAAGADDPVLVRGNFIQVANDHVGALGDYKLDAAGDLREPSAFTAYRVVQESDGTFGWDRFLQAEIKIGLLLLLDPNSINDVHRQTAMELGARDFNLEQAELGSGYKVVTVPIPIDDGPLAAITDAHINQQIDYYVGPITSAAASVVLDYANTNGLVLVSPSSAAPSLAIPDDSLFRLVPDSRHEAAFLSTVIGGDSNTVIVQRDDLWGRDLVAAFEGGYSGTISDTIIYGADITSVDFADIARQLEASLESASGTGSGQTSVLFVGFDVDFMSLARAILADDSLDAVRASDWYSTHAILSTRLVEANDVAAFAESANLVISRFAIFEDEQSDYVIEQLMEVHPGITPEPFLHTSYDAMHILGDAVISSFATNMDARDIFVEVAVGHFDDPLHKLRDEHHVEGEGEPGSYILNANGDLMSPITYNTYVISASDDGSYSWVLHGAGPDEGHHEPPRNICR